MCALQVLVAAKARKRKADTELKQARLAMEPVEEKYLFLLHLISRICILIGNTISTQVKPLDNNPTLKIYSPPSPHGLTHAYWEDPLLIPHNLPHNYSSSPTTTILLQFAEIRSANFDKYI